MNNKNDIDLNFDGQITNQEARKNLRVPIVTRKNTVKTSKALDDGAYSKMESLIKVSDLYLDMSYQRSPNEIKVSSIARNFDPDAFGVIICSVREDNIIAIIDGGHRIAAMRMLGLENTTVNALVYFGLTIQEEARIFTLINDERTKPKTSDIFRAEVTAGISESLELNKVLSDLKLVATNAPGYGHIRGIATMKDLHNKAGSLLLKKSLTTLTEAFGNYSSTYNIDLVSAICFLYKKYPEIDKSRMVQTLKKFSSVEILIGQAKTMAVGSSKPIRYTTLCSVIVSAYNHKLRANRLDDYQSPINLNKIWS